MNDKVTACEYYTQGEECDELVCEECGWPLSETSGFDGSGCVFYSIGPESVQWSIGDGSIVCKDCVDLDNCNVVQPV